MNHYTVDQVQLEFVLFNVNTFVSVLVLCVYILYNVNMSLLKKKCYMHVLYCPWTISTLEIINTLL